MDVKCIVCHEFKTYVVDEDHKVYIYETILPVFVEDKLKKKEYRDFILLRDEYVTGKTSLLYRGTTRASQFVPSGVSCFNRFATCSPNLSGTSCGSVIQSGNMPISFYPLFDAEEKIVNYDEVSDIFIEELLRK